VRSSFFIIGLALVPSYVFADTFTIRPGVGINHIRLGMTAPKLRQLLGEPTRDFRTHGGRKVESWLIASGDEWEAVYQSDKVVQLKATADDFRVVGKSLSPSRRKSAIYLYDSDSGRGVQYLDYVSGGVAYLYPLVQNGERRATAIVVHRKGHPAIVTDVKDLTNRGSVSQNEASCRAFVQQFYNWYVKATQNDGYEAALRSKRSSFSGILLAALRRDLAAAKKNQNEIVGLDFDPILNTQDPAERYVAGKTTKNRSVYRVEVVAKYSGGDGKPAVIPQLEHRGDRWVFTNFYYPGSGSVKSDNLLNILKDLEASRKPKRK
jgi:hypothetical protein